ncbi:MAG: class I SAM-dependent methyltransferase [Nitrososphaeraceae archaeon]
MKNCFYENSSTYGSCDKWSNDRLNICLKLIDGIKPKSFLDIGCGDGYFCSRVKSLFNADVIGVDISEKACELSNKRGINTIVADLQNILPFKNETFDVVFCGEVIEHLADTDFLLDEIYRILKKEGYLIITTPNLASWYNRFLFLFGIQPIATEVSFKKKYGHIFKFLGEGGNPVGHIRNFTKNSLTGLIKSHNFRIKSVQSTGWLNSWKKRSLIFKIDKIISNNFVSLGSKLIVLAKKYE